ncbi:MAG: 5-formyltetrahydrofolate cyclo-ligase [Candidatus Azobacteroides sp.]|nr:5-formyltetrahydrofolate cyclo-ligase [Candidatus Azobacteroides sp.]
MKDKIRKEIAWHKKEYTPEIKKKLSTLIFSQLELLSQFINAQKILLYHSLPDEVYTHDFIEKWKDKKEIFLPIVEGTILTLGKYHSREKCRNGSFGILEPSDKEEIRLSDMDLVIVPGIAFDKKGNRLGRGKGYYDKLLCACPVFKIGVCFDFQVREDIPFNNNDIPMDIIITENHLYKRK